MRSKVIIGHKNDTFRLLKDTDELKKGKYFESFGGLVFGIATKVDGVEIKINFSDKQYFKLKNGRKYFE